MSGSPEETDDGPSGLVVDAEVRKSRRTPVQVRPYGVGGNGAGHLDPSLAPPTEKAARLVCGPEALADREARIPLTSSCQSFCHSWTTHLPESAYDIGTARKSLGPADSSRTVIYSWVPSSTLAGVKSRPTTWPDRTKGPGAFLIGIHGPNRDAAAEPKDDRPIADSGLRRTCSGTRP